MISRRGFVAGVPGAITALAAGMAGVPGLARAEEPILTDDGLYKQSWFLESFLEMQDDLESAAAKGKRLAVMWELKGCPYCKETHFVNFGKPEIAAYVRERFEIVQMNIIGAREVVDFDGEKLSEKAFAEKYGIRFTPTFQFFPDSADGLKAKKPREREVTRAQGYLEPKHFLAMFRFVAEKGYEKGTLRDYLRAQG